MESFSQIPGLNMTGIYFVIARLLLSHLLFATVVASPSPPPGCLCLVYMRVPRRAFYSGHNVCASRMPWLSSCVASIKGPSLVQPLLLPRPCFSPLSCWFFALYCLFFDNILHDMTHWYTPGPLLLFMSSVFSFVCLPIVADSALVRSYFIWK